MLNGMRSIAAVIRGILLGKTGGRQKRVDGVAKRIFR